jgi:hypothetical protein
MSYQEIADKVAKEISDNMPITEHVDFQKDHRRCTVAWNGDRAMMQVVLERVAHDKASRFMELPIPDGAPGAIGRSEGVIVRAIRDYDILNDRHVTRVDVAYA